MTPKNVYDHIAKLRKLDPVAVSSRCRDRRLVEVRHVAHLYCHDILGLDQSDIGRRTERHHSTILMSIRKGRELIKEPAWKTLWTNLLTKGIKCPDHQ